jgi:hypothetical protein
MYMCVYVCMYVCMCVRTYEYVTYAIRRVYFPDGTIICPVLSQATPTPTPSFPSDVTVERARHVQYFDFRTSRVH